MGADWCPPGLLSLGIGGSPEKAMLMAKWAMMEPMNIHELRARGASTRAEELRLELYEKVNALGIGAQGLGGLSTVLDVKVVDYPTHAASKPVALLPNCAATRHLHFVLDGSGPATFDPPSLDDWPKVALDFASSRRVNLDTLTKAEIATWKAGETLLLSGKLLTGRDAAHKRMVDMMARGEKLPVDLRNRFIYYTGPVDAVRDEVVGPAGPTTSSRMDKFVEPVDEIAGLNAEALREDRAHRHGGEKRARPGCDRVDPQAWRGVLHRRGRRGLPRFQGDPRLARARVRRPRHGGDPRVRGEGHAGHGRRRFGRQCRAPHRTGRVAREDRQDSRRGHLTKSASLRVPALA